MAIVVVGGHARNIGKTTLATQILQALRHLDWTAIKISGHLHGGSTAMLTEELEPSSSTDSGRMLAAGARRALWLRTPPDGLAAVLPQIQQEIAAAPYTLIESNSILDVLEPRLYLSVVDASVADVKPSALRHLPRADALFVRGDAALDRSDMVAAHMFRGKPVFPLYAAELDPMAVQWLVTALHDSSILRNSDTRSALR